MKIQIRLLLGVTAGAVVLSSCGSGSSTASANKAADTSTATTEKAANELEAAARLCGVSANLGDENTTIILDTKGNDDYTGDDLSSVVCLESALEMPTYIVSQIGNTRALDGMQKAEWGRYQATWNYHPDSGMSLIIHRN